MIVVDSSALIAILEKEDDAARYAAAIEQAERLLISAMNAHETGMVLRVRRGSAAVTRMWRFLQQDMISRSCRLTKLKYGKHSTPSPALEIKSVRSLRPLQSPRPPRPTFGPIFRHQSRVQSLRRKTMALKL